MAYQAQQLVALACQICECPGRLVQAGQFLNLVLSDYAQTVDEDTIRKTTTLSVGPQPVIPYANPLPIDYLRMYDIWYLVNGEPFYLTQMELKDFDALFTGDGVDNYPQRWATDMATAEGGVITVPATAPNIYFYPPPAIPLTITARYRPQTADIVTPESSSVIPWFPNQLILLKDTCIQLGDGMGGDDRTGRWEAEVARRMQKYLIMSDDKEGYSQTVKLDPNTFRNRGNLPPSKKLGF